MGRPKKYNETTKKVLVEITAALLKKLDKKTKKLKLNRTEAIQHAILEFISY